MFEAGNWEREFKAREAAPRVQNCVIADNAPWITRLCLFAVNWLLVSSASDEPAG